MKIKFENKIEYIEIQKVTFGSVIEFASDLNIGGYYLVASVPADKPSGHVTVINLKDGRSTYFLSERLVRILDCELIIK